MKPDTRVAARGKWRMILPEFGFTPKQLDGTHQPCPICGGKDRFRFTDYKSNGDYFCAGCGPGSGFDLLMGTQDWEFAYAAKEVDKVLGNVSDEPVFAPRVNEEKRRKDLNSLWKGGTDHEVLEKYLFTRGMSPDELREDWLQDLRGHPGIYMHGSNKKHPAMLALIRNKDGVPVSIHRTYINEGVKKVMPPTEKMTGASVWLGRATGDELIVGEGIETTLSGMIQFGIKCGYSAISANNMEQLFVPPHIESVTILCDNDHTFTGQKASFTLARRLDNEGKRVDIVMARKRGLDYNDVFHASEAEDIHVFSNEEDDE